jgi:hypothetical protein
MQNLTFTTDGFLFPFEKITIDISTFKNVFVDDFPNSTTRKVIFDNYLRYLDDFSKEITPNFIQWIDGGFVTLKENPRDIDFVTFIDASIHDENETLIDNRYISSVTYNLSLDAYVMKVYPESESAYETYTLFHSENWHSRFIKTRRILNENMLLKGFIEIKF